MYGQMRCEPTDTDAAIQTALLGLGLLVHVSSARTCTAEGLGHTSTQVS